MGWIDEALTDQFYRWELRGRGWQHYDAPVSIEPPFRPFFGHFVAQNGSRPSDDGRHETIGSRLFGSVSRFLWPEPASQAAERATDDEPGPFYEERGEMAEDPPAENQGSQPRHDGVMVPVAVIVPRTRGFRAGRQRA